MARSIVNDMNNSRDEQLMHEQRATMFQCAFPMQGARKVAVRLMNKGFDWRSFIGLTQADMEEIDQVNLKPGDRFYGISLYGTRKNIKN